MDFFFFFCAVNQAKIKAQDAQSLKLTCDGVQSCDQAHVHPPQSLLKSKMIWLFFQLKDKSKIFSLFLTHSFEQKFFFVVMRRIFVENSCQIKKKKQKINFLIFFCLFWVGGGYLIIKSIGKQAFNKVEFKGGKHKGDVFISCNGEQTCM